ncbi:hypothetical protein NLG97_g4752 [Lecanicillium saksenae]|uniref:Uncharacterized protein n=1 Tax=Lecanicillium saksenae TaxID=468837 RepID=A0ACC1QUE3_9HYPO|nr:hypothetical protein NLG97_g4752 [Lecanicillium saksenae]
MASPRHSGFSDHEYKYLIISQSRFSNIQHITRHTDDLYPTLATLKHIFTKPSAPSAAMQTAAAFILLGACQIFSLASARNLGAMIAPRQFPAFPPGGSSPRLPSDGNLPDSPCGIGSDKCGSAGTTGCGLLVKLLPCPTTCCDGLTCEGGFFSPGTCTEPKSQ